MLKRILEPVILGSVANIVINYILHPQALEFNGGEFLAACLLSVPITELNLYIDKRLQSRLSWMEYPWRRFATHLLLLSLVLLISLNLLGNGYLLITQKGLFTWSEIVIVNTVTFFLALLLTAFNWLIHFYTRWKSAEREVSETTRLADELRQHMRLEVHHIDLMKGTSKVRAEVQHIQIARVTAGMVRVRFKDDEQGLFNGTLTELEPQLPTHLFFRVQRDAIIHRKMISSISSSTFGKVEITVQENGQPVTFLVSRLKAAAFRAWYNSTSAHKK